MVIAATVVLGANVQIAHPDLVNLYGCTIGDDVVIGPFVEIQDGSSIGARCKISSHSFICGGVVLEDDVMVGHGVMVTNDVYPRMPRPGDQSDPPSDWCLAATRIRGNAVIGSNATIIAGVTIGVGAIIGAGAVVTCDVPAHAVVVGAPSRVVQTVRHMAVPPASIEEAS